MNNVHKIMNVRNMTSDTSGREVPNQFVISYGDVVMFQSYKSPIVEINFSEKKVTVYSSWNYSRTTGRYRNQFMRDCGLYDMMDKAGFERCLKAGRCGMFKVESYC